MEGGGARGPVPRAFLAGDRPPWEGRALESELCRPLDGRRERAVPPPQRAGRRVGGGQGEHGQHEGLGIPEGVPVVPGAGQPLRRDRPVLAAGAGLQDVEQREAHGLLDLGIPVHLHVGAGPEVVKVGALIGEQPVPADLPGRAERRPHLVTYRRQRTYLRPAIRHELDNAQPLPWLQGGGCRDNAAVGV